MRDVSVILDMQFGSTGKGQVAGTVAKHWKPDTAVSVNGPNAGHTYRWTSIGGKQHKIIHTVLPCAAASPWVRNILLGPGSVFSIAQLAQEITALGDLGLLQNKRIIIHPNAMTLLPSHADAERVLVGIGSTMKGTAAAMIEKLQRGPNAPIARTERHFIFDALAPAARLSRCEICIDYPSYDDAILGSDKLLVEGAQGHSLSIHSPFYPHTTSRDVSLAQVWADCHLPALRPRNKLDVIGVCRTYPIRVANRFDAQGNQVGYSGDCYPDQQEIKWESLGREPELTTVTKLPRRIFTFSSQQILDAAYFNAPTMMALTFCDYVASPVANSTNPKGGDRITPEVMAFIRRVEMAAGCDVKILSYGPLDVDMFYHGKPAWLLPLKDLWTDRLS